MAGVGVYMGVQSRLDWTHTHGNFKLNSRTMTAADWRMSHSQQDNTESPFAKISTRVSKFLQMVGVGV